MNKVAVVIASFERPKLLKQTIETLQCNSEEDPEIIVVDDFSQNPEVDEYLKSLVGHIKYFRFPFRVPIHTIKNKGELLASESEYIHFSDNDVVYEPQWDSTLIEILEQKPEIGILGGSHHPHHQINSRERIGPDELIYSNEQPGYSLFMRRNDFKTFGPFFSEQLAGGEDSNFCRMAELAGFKIAAINPPVVFHCGASGTTGNRAADYAQILQLASVRSDIYVE